LTKKPKGARYRNLTARGGVIYYEKVFDGERVRFSCQTDDWQRAAEVRDLYESRRKEGVKPPEGETFAALAGRYLARGTGGLARTSGGDRAKRLREGVPILSDLGALKPSEVDRGVLREWWAKRIEHRGLKAVTGYSYLDAISQVIEFGIEEGLAVHNPMSAFRKSLRDRTGTQQRGLGVQSKIRPIREPEELRRLGAAAREEGPLAYVLLCLDAGLRSGEALALTWESIYWGAEGGKRLLHISASRSRGGAVGPTKSGRDREVALSFRLREALERLLGSLPSPPQPEDFVLAEVDQSNFRKREWRRILGRAGIGHRAIKDLRDSYAPHLLTLGISPAYISAQLGHADWSVTAKHYAAWVADEYVKPATLEPNEVPADLLGRLESPYQSPHGPKQGLEDETAAGDNSARPFGKALEHETGFEPATLTLAKLRRPKR